MSTEAKELDLVGKVELRIALTESDAKLQSTLGTYLAPLLLKLGSEHVNVRNKVIAVCQHISTRVKPPSIQLPVAGLLQQYKLSTNPLVRHFDLFYIQQGIDRISKDEQLSLFPIIATGLAKNYDLSKQNTAILFNLFLKLLHHFWLPARGSDEDVSLRERFTFIENHQDAQFLAIWIAKLALFSPISPMCPGLSKDDFNFLTLYGKEEVWKFGAPGSLNLVETKALASRFLASGAFVDEERFTPALIISADPNSRVAEIGDDILKRALSAVSLEDQQLVNELLTLYLGVKSTDGPPPARLPLKVKILAHLCRSKAATDFVPQIIEIVNEGLVADALQQSGTGKTINRGLEISKLRKQVFSFVNWVARVGSSQSLVAIAPTVIRGLRDYIAQQGWPAPLEEETSKRSLELESRSYGYESIGLLAASSAKHFLVEPDLDILRWLFRSLGSDSSGKNVTHSIEQALSTVLAALDGDIDDETTTNLESLLLGQMGFEVGDHNNDNDKVIRSTRYVAVRFANRCLPFSNVKARWIDLLAVSGSANDHSEIIEEGRKCLDPYWFRNLNPIKGAHLVDDPSSTSSKYEFPLFGDLVEEIFGTKIAEHPLQRSAIGSALAPAVTFCHYLLLHEALVHASKSPKIDSDWKKNIDAVLANDEGVRQYVKEYLRSLLLTKPGSANTLSVFLFAEFQGFVIEAQQGAEDIGLCLLQLCTLSPATVLDELSTGAEHLQSLIFANTYALRSTGAHVFGLLAARAHDSESQLQPMLDRLWTKASNWATAIGSEAVQAHGAILALAYYVSRKTCITLSSGKGLSDLPERLVTVLLKILAESHDKDLVDGSVEALSQLALFGVLTPNTMTAEYGASGLVLKLAKKAEAGNERAITAIGHLATQCSEDGSASSLLSDTIETLYGLHSIRQAEVQFSVGAALTCAAVGLQSQYLIGYLDIDAEPPTTPLRCSTLSSVLDKVLSDCKTTKPSLRQACVIWLLCLVQYCGHLDELKAKLPLCQVAFKGFLSDRDSLNQESASRGLALVYEKGDRSLKDDLVRDLVGSFTGSTANLAGTVSDETQLFEPGALPTGEGSITTYKDIMNLASEVGDSTLVYRFMALAMNNSIWSSRAAFGRFGLSNILSDSSTDGYLAENPKLYQALYRYRFDPNSGVRNSMNDIWSALVKDSSATIDKHFDAIMQDLLKHILTKEWRSRQASCAAVADLIQGRPLVRYEKYLTEIWSLTFKVCDDIKESVRSAAMSLARVLTGILTRSLEGGGSSTSANLMLKQILPFLLSPSGLESGANDVQAFALSTLLKIVKTAQETQLHDFVVDLLGRLITLLSSLERQEINYLHMNADKYGITTQQIDDMRLSGVSSSPMMDAIERCLDVLNDDTMKSFKDAFENVVKSAIGLPSKVGAARVAVSLATRHNHLFRPHADYFLRVLQRQVNDRNDTISTSFASACGYVARISSDDEILRLFENCKSMYLDSENERHRAIAGEIVFAIAKRATDRFSALAVDIVPFVFIAKHDSDPRTKDLFQDAWNESVGGSRAVSLYLSEICRMTFPYLSSPRWSVKHTSARAIADAVELLEGEVSLEHMKMIWPSLDKALDGKTWEGKETVLRALVKAAKKSINLKSVPDIMDRMQVIVIRESKRTNAQYRPFALACLADFVAIRKERSWFTEVWDIAKSIIEDLVSTEHEMDVDSNSGGSSSKTLGDDTLANASRALLNSINPGVTHGSDLGSQMSLAYELLTKVSASRSRAVQDAVLEGMTTLFRKLGPKDLERDQIESVAIGLISILFDHANPSERSRTDAVTVASTLASHAPKGGRLRAKLAEKLASVRQEERAPAVLASLDQAMLTLSSS